MVRLAEFVKRLAPDKLSAVERYIKIADKARDMRDWPKAASSYALALEQDANMAAIWVQYGHALKESGDHIGAKEAYRKALDLSPGNPDTYLQLGHVTKLMGGFAEAAYDYLQALLLDPANKDAQHELLALRNQGVKPISTTSSGELPSNGIPMIVQSRHTMIEASMNAIMRTKASHHIVFDISDLIQYFRDSRLPTGIQRVQMEIISAAQNLQIDDIAYQICCFVPEVGNWVGVSWELFSRLCVLATSNADTRAPEWTGALLALESVLLGSERLEFPRGAVLLNLGTSWWLGNYFLHVRTAKQQYGIKYVPFVHDLIPIVTPEHCGRNLTQEFVSWVMGAFQHGDHFLANSEATKADLTTVARSLGYKEVCLVDVIHLDANFRESTRGSPDRDVLAKFKLDNQPFVLFVGTIESRKNHLLAFDVWLKLIKKMGAGFVPKLVCVGKQGWLNEAAMSRLKASDALQRKVTILNHISDAELASLYQACLFTFYPSLYEGWGLPVTESLCFGKVPLVSKVSSLPEAGGQFAEYFDLESEVGLISQLERLIGDKSYRMEKEERIKSNFFPRTWSEISSELVTKLLAWQSVERSRAIVDEVDPEHGPGKGRVFPVQFGCYYPLSTNVETSIRPGMVNGEVYRSGGWWWPEVWGCWTKAEPAYLVFRTHPATEMRAYIGLCGLQRKDCRFELCVNGREPVSGLLRANEKRWITLNLNGSAEIGATFRVAISADHVEDFAEYTQGADRRVASIGVVGFMVCEQSDFVSRTNMLEAIVLDNFAHLKSEEQISD